jgi:Catalase
LKAVHIQRGLSPYKSYPLLKRTTLILSKWHIHGISMAYGSFLTSYSILDATKVWPEELVPKIPIGEIVLNRTVDGAAIVFILQFLLTLSPQSISLKSNKSHFARPMSSPVSPSPTTLSFKDAISLTSILRLLALGQIGMLRIRLSFHQLT